MRSSLDEVCVKFVGVSYWTLLVERFVLPQLRCRTQPTDACSETTNMSGGCIYFCVNQWYVQTV